MKGFKVLMAFLSVLALLFVTVPIINLFFPVSGEEFSNTLKDREVWSALLTSLECAAFSTVLGLFLGVPTAYLLSEFSFKGKEILEGLFDLPIVIPHVAVGIIFLKLLNSKTLLGEFFSKIGITFVDTVFGIVVVMCFVSISYIVTSSLIGFRAVDREIIWSARTLGASPFKVFYLLLLPLSLPSILRGAVLSFARSISEVGALLIIAYYPKTAPILMYERFENYGLKEAVPIAVLIVLISLLIFVLILSISRRGKFGAS